MDCKTSFPRLFTPLTIGGLTIPNRIVMSAVHLVYCPDGAVNERLTAFYARRAQGGAGLLIVGGCAVDRRGYSAGMLRMDSAAFGPGLEQLTAAVHAQEGLAAAQLFQSGRYAKPAVTGYPGLAPSPVYARYSGHTPEEMTHRQIDETVRAYADAARLARESGFDAVEILAGAGYLISEFLSPLTNLRTDAFGGDQENRFRFAGLVLEAVRGAVGDGFPILVRIAGNDFVAGGSTLPEAAAFARFLAGRGADAINVTGGWHETAVPQLTGHLPPGGFSYLAAEIKRHVQIPVFASNRFNDPALAERELALGEADAVCMCRQLICDPDTPRKARAGREADILPCIACGQGCTDHTFAGKPLGCVLNPFAGAEHILAFARAGPPRSILVAGGGPAGLATAVTAARLGHRVTLCEQSDRLGGRLRALARMPSKEDYGRLLEALLLELRQSGVSVRLRQSFDLSMAAGADAVVLAVGGRPVYPENRGFAGQLCTAEDVLLRRATPGERVVVLEDWESALWLAEDGAQPPALGNFLRRYRAEPPEQLAALERTRRRSVTVVSRAEKVAGTVGIGTRWVVKAELERYGVGALCGAAAVSLVPEGVLVRCADGTTQTIPADTVVLSDRVGNEAFKAPNLHPVGDAASPGGRGYVISAAIRLALRL